MTKNVLKVLFASAFMAATTPGEAASGARPVHPFQAIFDQMGASLPPVRTPGFIGLDMRQFDTHFDRLLTQFKQQIDARKFTDEEIRVFREQTRDNLAKVKVDVPALPLSPPRVFNRAAPAILMINPEDPKRVLDGDIGSNPVQRLREIDIWERLKAQVEVLGVPVHTFPGSLDEGGARETFTRDRFITLDGIAFVPDGKMAPNIPDSTYAHDVSKEVAQVTDILKTQPLKTIEVNGAWFEGGNIIPYPEKGIIFMAFAPGVSEDSALKLQGSIQQATGKPYTIKPLRMTEDSKDFYHLDTFMSPVLSRGHMMLYPDMLAPDDVDFIERIIGTEKFHRLTKEEALEMATNINNISGENVIVTKKIPSVSAKLRSWGYQVHEPADDAGYLYGRGGARCLTSFPLPRL